MYNPGGFTDGDRAACFLTALGRKENVKLLGTRSDIVGRWSGDTEKSSKLQKLQWTINFGDPRTMGHLDFKLPASTVESSA